MVRSKRNCCVVNCGNRECSSGVSSGVSNKFYRFPGRSYETERRQRWIQAINRKNQDGSLWTPTENSRICSAHFIGGEKSDIAAHPAYIPSIFPELYKKRKPIRGMLERFDRALKRQKLHSSNGNEAEHDIESDIVIESMSTRNTAEVSTQVSFELVNDSFLFMSSHDNNNASTQCNVTDFPARCVKDVKEQQCGTDDAIICKGFHGFSNVKTCDTKLRALTSVDPKAFQFLLGLLIGISQLSTVLDIKNVLLLFLMKMKLGLSFSCLGVLFDIHKSTASRLFTRVLEILTDKTNHLIVWPSKYTIESCTPECFKVNEEYKHTRVIIDCAEIRTDQPSRVDDRVYMYSSYKSGYTFKVLIGIAPNGTIIFRSNCYGGRSSDSYITVNSGLLDLLEPGDLVLADKGFPGIKTSLQNNNVLLVMPPILHDGRFSEEEIVQTYSVASVRIHVERAIQRIKIYKILKHIPSTLFQHVDDIVHIACVLANLLPPLLKQDTSTQEVK